MAITTVHKPLVTSGWKRALIFLVTYFLLLLGIGFVIGLFATLSSDTLHAAKTSTRVFPVIAATALLSIGFVLLFVRFFDRRSLSSIGFDLKEHWMHAGTGFSLGIALVALATLLLIATKNLEWTDVNFDANGLFLGFGLMVLVSLAEEMVFRGYLLYNLMESMSRWPALVVSAVLFAAFHINNPGVGVMPVVNVLLAGVLMGVNFVYTRNLWFGLAFHFAWNFSQGSVFGYKVSGIDLPSLFRQELTGDPLYTGGAFGLEGSAYTTLLLVMTIAILIWVYERKTVYVRLKTA
jgi:uncharacterized protein